MAISDKIKQSMEQSSWIRRMFETGARLKQEHGADKVFDFSLGNPNIDPPAEFSTMLKKTAGAELPGKHGYMPNAGYPEVRHKVAEFISREYQTDMNAGNCILTCGAGGALNVIFKTILNPGDTIVVSRPCFMEYRFYADNHQGLLDICNCEPDFDLDVKDIEAHITAKTAAVLINSPNNPSGKIYRIGTLEKLAAMLERKSRETGRTIYLISDEPYRRIVFDGIKVPSIFNYYKNSIVATSFSKDLSIPGERIGWLAIHPEAVSAGDLVNGAILCNRILGYVNAPALMQRIIGEVIDYSVDVSVYRENRDLLCSELARMGYELTVPQGAFYLFPKAPGGDDIAFTQALQNELVLVVPGSGFAMPGYFRIAYCVNKKTIENALPGFRRAIENTVR
ncbi:MAG: pyridoxal phosphate-dependent aminotransferase [Spirochaetales bacterium]|nr:pyridoxal phosphate-dependent aminotransferase [Spirochaetales bacterium]